MSVNNKNKILITLIFILFISCNERPQRGSVDFSLKHNNDSIKFNKMRDSVIRRRAIGSEMQLAERADSEQPTQTFAEERKRLVKKHDEIET